MSGQYPQMNLPAGVYIVGVQPGFTRDGSRQKFDVQCSDGQVYTTFRPQAASKAQGFINNPNVTVTISVNGNYKNFEDVNPSMGGAAMPAPTPGFPPMAPAPAALPVQQFTPAPGFVDAKQVEFRRGAAIGSACDALAPFIGTGFYTDEAGTLDIDRVADDLIALAGRIARYAVEGPSADTASADPTSPPPLPPGVTPEMLAAWAAAQGADVAVGPPAAAEEPTQAY